MDLAAKGLGAEEWNNSLKTKLSLLPKKLFRIRMSRNFGMKIFLIKNPATTEIYTLSLHDALPISPTNSWLPWRTVPWCTRSTPSLPTRSEEHTSELQSQFHLVCRLLLEKKKSQIWTLLLKV